MKDPENRRPVFLLLCFVFNLIFFSNTLRLWIKTDTDDQDIDDSLTRAPFPYPIRVFHQASVEQEQREKE